ncbi:sialin-like [Styela clava]
MSTNTRTRKINTKKQNAVENTSYENEETENTSIGCYIKARHIIVLMSFIAKFNSYSMRTNLSVAVVAMVNQTDENTSNNTSDVCPDHGSSEIDEIGENGSFNWDIGQESLLLGCYYYGYIISNFVGGYLAKRFGIKLVLGISMFLSSIVTILSPPIAKASFGLFVAARTLLGALQGPISPSVHAAIGKWIPPLELTKAVAIASSGNCIGTLVTLPVAGIIADQLGWEEVFYITGGIALPCSLLLIALVHDSPSDHPRISEEEKSYIEKTTGISQENLLQFQENDQPTPWKSIFTSIPLWATTVGVFACNWATHTYLSLLPTYMSSILRFNLAASGTLSALPYLLQFLTLLVAGYFCDIIRQRRIAKTVTVRKVNSFLSLVIPSIFIVLAGYSGCNVAAAVSFFSISVAFLAFNVTSHEANIIDLAPRYSGITCGVINAIANFPGFLAPQMAGLILLNGQTIQQWQYVFWMSAVVATVGFIFFAIFGSGQVQPWALLSDCNDTSISDIVSSSKVYERSENIPTFNKKEPTDVLNDKL